MLKLSKKINSPDDLQGRQGLIYARVSSKRQEIEGTGLQSQEGRCRAELEAIKVPYSKTFPDSYTGGGDFMNRPAMSEMLDYIDNHPHKKFVVIFDDLKRFARDTEFHLKLRRTLEARNVIIKCLNFTFDGTPEGRFAELIMAGQAELERHQNKRQVIQKQKSRLELGYWSFGSKKGYKMTKDPQHGMLSIPTAEGLEVLKPALELFANGTFVRKIDACEFLVSKGFWKKQHFSAYIDKFSYILRDPFYMGDIEYLPWDVSRRKGRHVGIISEETFNLIQKRIDKNGLVKSIRKDTSEDFPMRGLLVCSSCGYSITAAWTRARGNLFPYYFCQNKLCEFGKKSIPKKVVESQFDDLLKKAKLKVSMSKLISRVFDDVWKEELQDIKKSEAESDKKRNELQNKAKELTDLICNSKNELLKSAYETRLEEVMNEMESISSKGSIKSIDLSIPYRNSLDKVLSLVTNPYSVWEKMPVMEKHQLFFFLFEEKLAYSKKEGYRNDKLPYAVRVFEEFATSNSQDVEMVTLKPHA